MSKYLSFVYMVAPYFLVGAGLATIIAGILYLTSIPVSAKSPDDIECRVVQYRVGSSTTCAIECAWVQGYSGFAVSTPTDCENMGEPVTRSTDSSKRIIAWKP